MGVIRELGERFWKAEVDPRDHWKATGQVEELLPGVFFLHAFANVTVVRTEAGLLLVDSSNPAARAKTFTAVRAIDPAPLHTAIYTHGHVDHACGLPPFLEEARSRGWPRPRIVDQLLERPRVIAAFAGASSLAQAQFIRLIDDRAEAIRVNGGQVTLELSHARGETDDHTWIWWPARQVLWSGDLFIWVAPNAGNPQKVQRYAAEWAAALRRMAALRAAVLIPGHGVPIVGAERVRQALADTAEWLEHLIEETVARMNAGASLDAILRAVQPPAHLADRPYLQPIYDEPDYVVRNIWRLYGGWWDGVPSHLKPASDTQLAREVAGLAGGVTALVTRARALAAEGELALAGHLVDWAVAADPANRDAHAARAEVYEARALESRALMTRGIFSAAARESAARASGEG